VPAAVSAGRILAIFTPLTSVVEACSVLQPKRTAASSNIIGTKRRLYMACKISVRGKLTKKIRTAQALLCAVLMK
jgi:hypothetical protein